MLAAGGGGRGGGPARPAHRGGPVGVGHAGALPLRARGARRAALYVEERKAQTLLKTAVAEAILTFNQAHPLLQIVFPGEKARIRSFYDDNSSDTALESA